MSQQLNTIGRVIFLTFGIPRCFLNGHILPHPFPVKEKARKKISARERKIRESKLLPYSHSMELSEGYADFYCKYT